MPLLLDDDFYATAQAALTTAGFLLTLVQRHEPTTIEGTTPKGFAFSFSVQTSGWRLVYRNRPAVTGPADADWWQSSVIESRLRTVITAAGG